MFGRSKGEGQLHPGDLQVPIISKPFPNGSPFVSLSFAEVLLYTYGIAYLRTPQTLCYSFGGIWGETELRGKDTT